MISVHPYILRALYQWICDTNLTPQLLVDTDNLEVVVPKEYIENDHIILNISPTAVRDLVLGDEYIMFNARFGGRFRKKRMSWIHLEEYSAKAFDGSFIDFFYNR